MTTQSLFTHPITLMLLGALISAIGYLVVIVVGLIKDSAKLTQVSKEISEILQHVVARQDTTDSNITDIKNDLQELLGEHRMMIKTGNLIAMHTQKKS